MNTHKPNYSVLFLILIWVITLGLAVYERILIISEDSLDVNSEIYTTEVIEVNTQKIK